MVVYIIQQGSLLVRLRPLTGYVIEKYGKCPYSQFVHPFELVHERIPVFLVPADVLSRMDSPIKQHVILVCPLHQLLQLGSLLLGIRLPPVRGTMIRVVFGAVQVHIHLVTAIKIQLAQPGFMAPWSTIKTLHHSTEGNIRIVLHLHQWYLSLCQQLCECLHPVIGSTFIGTDNHNRFLSYSKIIAFSHLRNFHGIFLHALVALQPHLHYQFISVSDRRCYRPQQFFRRSSCQRRCHLQVKVNGQKNRVRRFYTGLRCGLNIQLLGA